MKSGEKVRHRSCWLVTPIDKKMARIGKGKKVSGSKSGKEHERYYLLPGQGGHAYRRKQQFILKWTIIAALVVSAALAAALYWMNHSKP
jgi:hypothetical protein